jgi:hypothetical protein
LALELIPGTICRTLGFKLKKSIFFLQTLTPLPPNTHTHTHKRAKAEGKTPTDLHNGQNWLTNMLSFSLFCIIWKFNPLLCSAVYPSFGGKELTVQCIFNPAVIIHSAQAVTNISECKWPKQILSISFKS